ncbi:hypothetical protein N0V90_012778 [Kalmusia sp. IMI 367209]|nr:hypothetical protein N0V90_012778 [Kalmusia sp. IMI 367209]
MAASAQAVEDVIDGLDQENDAVQLLQHSLVPVLHHLEGNPLRAIVIFVAVRPSLPQNALWSTLSIIYLFFANRSARKSYRDLKRNSRIFRVLISLVTLILWIAAIVCSALLVVEFGVFTITVGPETKTAMTILKAVIMQALQQATKSNETISNALNIVNQTGTNGADSSDEFGKTRSPNRGYIDLREAQFIISKLRFAITNTVTLYFRTSNFDHSPAGASLDSVTAFQMWQVTEVSVAAR